MHYHAEIYLKELKDVEKQIERILHPYSEHLEIEYDEEDEYWYNPNSFWDWYQIGGRWTGEHTGYDPYSDIKNTEVCNICEGTGFRNDHIGIDARINNPSYTCNGCGEYDRENQEWKHGRFGAGLKLVWSTQFKPYDGDIINISEVKEDLSCYTLIINGDVWHKEEWTGKGFRTTEFDGNVKKMLDILGIKDGYLVTVDYHN